MAEDARSDRSQFSLESLLVAVSRAVALQKHRYITTKWKAVFLVERAVGIKDSLIDISDKLESVIRLFDISEVIQIPFRFSDPAANV
jgi:hypothetical protein